MVMVYVFLIGVLVFMVGARLVVLIGIWFVVVLDCIWFRPTTGGVGFIFGGLVAGWLVFRL